MLSTAYNRLAYTKRQPMSKGHATKYTLYIKRHRMLAGLIMMDNKRYIDDGVAR